MSAFNLSRTRSNKSLYDMIYDEILNNFNINKSDLKTRVNILFLNGQLTSKEYTKLMKLL
jgi:hypothetical protein